MTPFHLSLPIAFPLAVCLQIFRRFLTRPQLLTRV